MSSGGEWVLKSDVIAMLHRLADNHADQAIFGESANARQREAMEAAFTHARCAVALMPASPVPPSTDTLNAEQSEAFVSALLNPPAPNEALRRAAERYRKAIETQKSCGVYPTPILIEAEDAEELVCAISQSPSTDEAREGLLRARAYAQAALDTCDPQVSVSNMTSIRDVIDALLGDTHD